MLRVAVSTLIWLFAKSVSVLRISSVFRIVKFLQVAWVLLCRGSKFSSFEIELRNRVTENDVTLRVTNSEIFMEIIL